MRTSSGAEVPPRSVFQGIESWIRPASECAAAMLKVGSWRAGSVLGGIAEKPMKKERERWSGSSLLQDATDPSKAITKGTARVLERNQVPLFSTVSSVGQTLLAIMRWPAGVGWMPSS